MSLMIDPALIAAPVILTQTQAARAAPAISTQTGTQAEAAFASQLLSLLEFSGSGASALELLKLGEDAAVLPNHKTAQTAAQDSTLAALLSSLSTQAANSPLQAQAVEQAQGQVQELPLQVLLKALVTAVREALQANEPAKAIMPRGTDLNVAPAEVMPVQAFTKADTTPAQPLADANSEAAQTVTPAAESAQKLAEALKPLLVKILLQLGVEAQSVEVNVKPMAPQAQAESSSSTLTAAAKPAPAAESVLVAESALAAQAVQPGPVLAAPLQAIVAEQAAALANGQDAAVAEASQRVIADGKLYEVRVAALPALAEATPTAAASVQLQVQLLEVTPAPAPAELPMLPTRARGELLTPVMSGTVTVTAAKIPVTDSGQAVIPVVEIAANPTAPQSKQPQVQLGVSIDAAPIQQASVESAPLPADALKSSKAVRSVSVETPVSDDIALKLPQSAQTARMTRTPAPNTASLSTDAQALFQLSPHLRQFTSTQPTQAALSDFASAVSQQARLLHAGFGARELTLSVSPPNLGDVTVSMTERDGGIDLQIRVPNAEARDAIRSQVPALVAQVAGADLPLRSVEVTDGNNGRHSQSNSNGQQNARHDSSGGQNGDEPKQQRDARADVERAVREAAKGPAPRLGNVTSFLRR